MQALQTIAHSLEATPDTSPLSDAERLVQLRAACRLNLAAAQHYQHQVEAVKLERAFQDAEKAYRDVLNKMLESRGLKEDHFDDDGVWQDPSSKIQMLR